MKLFPTFTHPCAILAPYMWNIKGEILKNVLVAFLHTITKEWRLEFLRSPKRM